MGQTNLSPQNAAPQNAANTRVAVMVGLVAVSMVGLSFAAVPLYQLFCQVTGFGGTTQIATIDEAGGVVLDRNIKVRFDANTHAEMPWDFKPLQTAVDIKVGEPALVFYEASNPTNDPIAGTAIFNVTPLKAGQYFNKVQCFCFSEQILQPGQSVQMPVELFIDPRIADDPNAADVHTITLSYTFFKDDAWEEGVSQ